MSKIGKCPAQPGNFPVTKNLFFALKNPQNKCWQWFCKMDGFITGEGDETEGLLTLPINLYEPNLACLWYYNSAFKQLESDVKDALADTLSS